MLIDPLNERGYKLANESLHRAELTTFVKLLVSLRLYRRESLSEVEERLRREKREYVRAPKAARQDEAIDFHMFTDIDNPVQMVTGKKRKLDKQSAAQVSPRHLSDMQSEMEAAMARDQDIELGQKQGYIETGHGSDRDVNAASSQGCEPKSGTKGYSATDDHSIKKHGGSKKNLSQVYQGGYNATGAQRPSEETLLYNYQSQMKGILLCCRILFVQFVQQPRDIETRIETQD